MSDLSNLLLLLALAAVVGLWLKLSAARERAVREARQQCQQHGVQLLDETVGLRAVRLRRINGLRMLERCYGFEVSIDGHDRESGRLWMIGDALSSLSLPTIELLPHEEAAARNTAVASGNVVPLRPRNRPN
ncbi:MULTISPECIES: DUF3301 domain-containing protein [Rhodanobacter]|uniref:DUF3301 domain-containing protein n=1 Tax=Rhodanobacter TaxID=75309 RepID=UPI00042807C8|nr:MULTISPECIES: DUF3301 domain-containing protein [Rhodanobacter]KZC20332.1 hypothetical protein RHOFW104R3_26330 [Rhodanobacter denitrificans]UJJ50127.1 DUF3301 domain-containing protein [Rhodanobacter denitrificans]UJM92842.1 DUF3301 domain-containing protein [Rhodanobacter denitrificans]UJM96372.1 DUF3301 domain-containing protein [Rhodanobacter denitrificans]UJN20797.1 DUF3301 domain-containing protein [Rhodanobacter denitrificans]